MKNIPSTLKSLVTVIALTLVQLPTDAGAHCQVPCGIFADQQRFEALLEDHTTITKAAAEIARLSGEAASALNANQLARWVVTKEQHAQKIQDTIAAYFMAQRIKGDAENYPAKLQAAHKVMTAAMKTKQDPSAEVAAALKTAILDFYRAYEGKEPHFDDKH